MEKFPQNTMMNRETRTVKWKQRAGEGKREWDGWYVREGQGERERERDKGTSCSSKRSEVSEWIITFPYHTP